MTRICLYLCATAVIRVLLLCSSVIAEQSEIYLVDMQRVIDESIIGKAAKSTVEAEAKKSEMKLQVLRSEIEKLRDGVAKQSSVLSASALDERKDQLAKRERDLERTLEDQREMIGRKKDIEMSKVVEHIDKAVRALAGSGKYPVILERDPRFIIYADSRLDLTKLVVEKVDEGQL